jgi:hypothetical protein
VVADEHSVSQLLGSVDGGEVLVWHTASTLFTRYAVAANRVSATSIGIDDRAADAYQLNSSYGARGSDRKRKVHDTPSALTQEFRKETKYLRSCAR